MRVIIACNKLLEKALYSLFFLVGGYMKDSLKGSMINFEDIHLQSSFQACHIFTPLF